MSVLKQFCALRQNDFEGLEHEVSDVVFETKSSAELVSLESHLVQNSLEASLHVLVLAFEFICGYLLDSLDKARVLPDLE